MFDRLPDYFHWANSRTLDSWRGLDPQPAEAARLMRHILAAEEIWVARLRGAVPRVAVWPEVEPEPFPDWIARNAECLRGFLASADLAAVIEYRTSTGALWRSRVADVLIHLPAHGNHHRGQIASIVKAAGGAPAMTDYVFFTRETPSL